MRKTVSSAALLVLLSVAAAAAGAAESSPIGPPADCAAIEDGRARLSCYDAQSGRSAGEEPAEESYLSRTWDLSKTSRGRTFSLTPYRSNYLLPFTYNGSPNEDPIRAVDPGGKVLHEEVQFQISFKVKLWEDVLGRDVDLWAAYTQRSFWQFYDFDGSAPFRETDFEPELLLTFRTDYRLLGLRGRFVSVGLDHQSNGRARPLSRSWNRVTANAGFERGSLVLVLRGWYRIPENELDDDNPGIDRYLGYGEAELFTFLRGCRLGLLLRNNLRTGGNRGAIQLTASFPLLRRVSGYLLYFNGYGESLLDYNASSNRFGIGFVLKEW
jgi:phospholipase A1/A2